MEIFNYFGLALYGLTIGVLTKTITPGIDKGGFISTSILGVLGSILGGFIFSLLGWPFEKGFSLSGFIPAFLGSIIILILYKIIIKKSN